MLQKHREESTLGPACTQVALHQSLRSPGQRRIFPGPRSSSWKWGARLTHLQCCHQSESWDYRTQFSQAQKKYSYTAAPNLTFWWLISHSQKYSDTDIQRPIFPRNRDIECGQSTNSIISVSDGTHSNLWIATHLTNTWTSYLLHRASQAKANHNLKGHSWPVLTSVVHVNVQGIEISQARSTTWVKLKITISCRETWGNMNLLLSQNFSSKLPWWILAFVTGRRDFQFGREMRARAEADRSQLPVLAQEPCLSTKKKIHSVTTLHFSQKKWSEAAGVLSGGARPI